MKICFYRHSLLNRGGDKMVVQYANYLHCQGHSVTVATNIVSSVFELQADIQKISDRGSSKIHTIAYSLFNKWTFDILIADIIIMVFFLTLRNKKNVVYFAQDYDESYYRNPFLRMLIRIIYFYCLAVRKIPVIAVSQELGSLLERRFSARVTVIPNGVDTEIFYPDQDNEYVELKDRHQVILLFARSDYRKGFDIALRVLQTMKKAIDRGCLAIWAVGEKINVPFKIHHFGFVQPQTLRKILSCSDALLYPSRHEGLPLFVLEAMACGCPVVTTEAVQFISDGIDAFRCKVDDVDKMTECLEKILSNLKARNAIIENAFKTVEKYDLKYSMNMFEGYLQQRLRK